MTRSDDGSIRAYVTFRLAGDDLNPRSVSRALGVTPTLAYAKGESYFAGKRTGWLTGGTGIWLLSTEKMTSPHLADHIGVLYEKLFPDAHAFARLRNLIAQKNLEASMSCFWHGLHGAKRPTLPRELISLMRALPAEIETDFAVDEAQRRIA